MSKQYYRPDEYGPEEVKMMQKFHLQMPDARQYFLNMIKPRLDRSYKLYAAYNGDRANEIDKWQANIFTPYIQAVVETMMPRVLDARPDFTVQGRSENDQIKAPKVQMVCDYTWEKASADVVLEDVARATMINGIGFMMPYWKKDVRKNKFLTTADIASKKYKFSEKEQTFYDAPAVDWVDNYSLWYDWHNVKRESKQFWFRRLILTGEEIKRKYPMADPERLKMAVSCYSGDLVDYASIRTQVKSNHYSIVKGADHRSGSNGLYNVGSMYMDNVDPDLKMHEVFEWWLPFEDKYSVICNWVPILYGGFIPNPYNFKEAPFIDIPYLRMPGEFEGYGIPLILENPQIMLNMIKNQRLDATTMSIHKMWVVNPLANVNKQELVTRPFGIIYSTDPNGVREVQFSDIKQSAYQEEDNLKSDMRYASGVDDFSMGAGGNANSATEVRHLRESTLERVRLFVNHLGAGLSTLQRWWISMFSQFGSQKMILRIVGEDGKDMYPLIERDDLMGEFDFKSSVIPSIAGQNDINKKQNMDLFQLLINLDFIDPKKLISRTLQPWGWDLESLLADQQAPGAGQMPPGMEGGAPPVGPDGQPLPPEMAGAGAPPQLGAIPPSLSGVSPDVAKKAMSMLGSPNMKFGGGPSPFAEASTPINLISSGAMPPTVKGAPKNQSGKGGNGPATKPIGNTRGHNRGGKVNTSATKLNSRNNSSPESSLLNRAFNLQ